MDLYLIRHGQSQNNTLWGVKDYRRQRVADPKLTEVGEQQASATAKALFAHGDPSYTSDWDPQNIAGFNFTHIYCSLMERAVQTAYPLSEAYDLPLLALDNAYEYGGLFQHDPETDTEVGVPGLGKAHFETHYPRLVYPETAHPDGWWKSRSKEPTDQALARSQTVLQTLLDTHEQQDQVALISHAGFINYMIEARFGTKIINTENWMLVNNTSITRLHFNQQFSSIFYLNRTDHLSNSLITS